MMTIIIELMPVIEVYWLETVNSPQLPAYFFNK